MRNEYDFSKAMGNPYAERIRSEGFSITQRLDDGSVQARNFPPGAVPSLGRTVHVYRMNKTWVVRTEGASRAYRRVSKEEDATMIGLRLARNAGAELVVHFSGTKRKSANPKAA